MRPAILCDQEESEKADRVDWSPNSFATFGEWRLYRMPSNVTSKVLSNVLEVFWKAQNLSQFVHMYVLQHSGPDRLLLPRHLLVSIQHFITSFLTSSLALLSSDQSLLCLSLSFKRRSSCSSDYQRQRRHIVRHLHRLPEDPGTRDCSRRRSGRSIKSAHIQLG